MLEEEGMAAAASQINQMGNISQRRREAAEAAAGLGRAEVVPLEWWTPLRPARDGGGGDVLWRQPSPQSRCIS